MPTNQVSIDRITVSGELKAEYRELQRVMNALEARGNSLMAFLG